MKEKGLKVDCPFCKGKLWIDPKKGDILHQEQPKKDYTEGFDDFLEKSKKEDKILSDKFKAAREKENTRLERLEKKYNWAKNNPDELDNKE